MAENSTSARFLDADQEPSEVLIPIAGYEIGDLMSLDEAVAPLVPLFHNLHAMVETVKKRARNPENGLTQDESAAIHLYTIQWPTPYKSLFTLLNQRLRSNERDSLEIWYPYLKLFMTALHKLPSTKPCIIWRGIRGDVSALYEVDQIWWGVSSCTGTVEIITKFIGTQDVRTLFSIECINGKDIHAHSQYKKENEILLMPGTYLKVVSKAKLSDNLHLIHLRETLPPYLTITSPFSSSTQSSESITSNSQASSTTLPVTTMPSVSIDPSVSEELPEYHNESLERIITENSMNSELKLVLMRLTDRDMKIVANLVLRNNQTLQYLNLSNNNIESEGAHYLCDALRQNNTLLKFRLYNNQIGSIGTLYISDALNDNKTLTSLDLSSNQIEDDGVRYLCQALYNNKTLKELNLSFNQISLDGAKHLNYLLKEGSMLNELDLSGNELRNEGIQYIADGIQYNTTLECLKLTSNEIHSAGLQYISDVLATNSVTNRTFEIQARPYIFNRHFVSCISVTISLNLMESNI